MKTPVKALLAASALIALGGCVAVPVAPGYYEPAPVVYVSPPVYYGPPAYYGPSIRFGTHGGRHRHFHGGPRGYRYR